MGIQTQPLDPDQAIQHLLAAIEASRLVLLCGAGLSMAPPSNLPSAVELAKQARDKYIASFQPVERHIPDTLDQQAEFFHEQGTLQTYFLRALVRQDVFSAPSNSGHYAVADLLLCGALGAAVSTNVDSLIENAGDSLFGQIEVALDGAQASMISDVRRPLLKIHGCWKKDRSTTIWTSKQLDDDPIKLRIEKSRQWLGLHLGDKDLLIVGFWSDWAYLNSVLSSALGEVHPSQVIIVDLAETVALTQKAPELCALGGGKNVRYRHVQTSGAEFLDALRVAFSRAFVRKVLHQARDAYEQATGTCPDPSWLEPSAQDATALRSTRRDLEGRRPNEPAHTKAPDDIGIGPRVGLVILQLRARGAISQGPCWRLGRSLIRVLRTPDEFIHNIKKHYERENPPVNAPDIVVCVGAEESWLPSDIVRGTSQPTIARGGPPGEWLTVQQATRALEL